MNGRGCMYAMTAVVEPSNVRFDAPMMTPAVDGSVRELTDMEIDSVSGGIVCGGVCVAAVVVVAVIAVGFVAGAVAGYAANS